MTVHTLKLFVALLLVLSARSTYSSGCSQAKLDVVVLLDGSGSVGSTNFIKLKTATLQMAKDLNLAPDGTRFGTIVYSSRIRSTIPLSSDIQDLESSIPRLYYPGGGTGTDLGIRAIMQMFQSQKRIGAKQVGIVSTDGVSVSQTRTIEAAKEAKQAGIIMFAVGVGNKLNMVELNAIGSDPSKVLHLTNFDDLTTTFKSVEDDICSVCKGELDIVAVLDASGSIGRGRFEKLKDAAIQVAKDLELGPDAQRFGVVVFNHRHLHTIPLSSDFNDLQSKISGLSPTRGGTATHKGIKAMEQLFASLGRNGVRKVGIVLTDGRSKSPGKTKSAATEAKNAGVTMFAVGIGPFQALSMEELGDIASSPSDVLHVEKFDLLKTRFEALIQTICKGNEKTVS